MRIQKRTVRGRRSKTQEGLQGPKRMTRGHALRYLTVIEAMANIREDKVEEVVQEILRLKKTKKKRNGQ